MSLLKLKLLVLSWMAERCLSAQVVHLDRFTFTVDDHALFLSQSAVLEQEHNRSYLSGHMMINRLVNDITLTSSMDIIRPRRPEMRLYNVKLNFCSVLNNGYKNKFIRLLYNNYAGFLNTKPKCPLKPNFNYSLTRAFVDEDLLPDLLPECTYRFRASFEQKSKPLAHMQLDGRLVAKVGRSN
ncbi:uncharacterized protein [Drosophila kikkawai]|uniref:Uncharacterized protein n=1 Tax=Drosophila kikkawai TaxID=30033 RepID=A0A6P4HW95_DROKI|nr:uncharacterized protein LOC108070422 [Drosophila kikkawai]KAH8340555.1 hypothetical protein KR059_001184 [Drosophila kikkawai]